MDKLKFFYDGKVITESHTPQALKMKEDVIIVVEYKVEE